MSDLFRVVAADADYDINLLKQEIKRNFRNNPLPIDGQWMRYDRIRDLKFGSRMVVRLHDGHAMLSGVITNVKALEETP